MPSKACNYQYKKQLRRKIIRVDFSNVKKQPIIIFSKNPYIRAIILRTIRLFKISHVILSKTILTKQITPTTIWNGMHQKCLLTTFQLSCPSPYLHAGQNILLNACSLRTFANLTTRNGGSYIRICTVI